MISRLGGSLRDPAVKVLLALIVGCGLVVGMPDSHTTSVELEQAVTEEGVGG